MSRRLVALIIFLGAFLTDAFLPDYGTAKYATAVYAKKGKTSANAKDQKDTWKALNVVGSEGLCFSGKEQSPIDVLTSKVMQTTEPVITTHIDTVLSYVRNTGYGFQLFEMSGQSSRYDVNKPSKISTLDLSPGAKGYSMISGSKYNFYQVNWHTPSENTVDGTHAIMEAHFVHQLTGMSDAKNRLAIIAMMYDLGSSSECNSFLNSFWELFPQSKGVKKYAGLVAPSLKKLLESKLLQGYYHWYGSLTTPPCTEGVNWNLLLSREKVCQQQVDMLKEGLSSTNLGINFNNRVTQPLNHRAVALIQPDNARAKPTNTAILPALAAKWYYAPANALKADAAEQKKWGGLCSVGHEQSPINVVTMETAKTGLPSITTSFTTKVSYVKNTGRGFQLFEDKPGRHTLNAAGTAVPEVPAANKGYAMINGDKFNFYQVNWHSPSENTIDGKSFAMEAQFVHQLNDETLVSGNHRKAIISLLYDMGSASTCNTFLNRFWAQFPPSSTTTEVNKVFVGDNNLIDFNAKLKEKVALGYYHWMGSLTAPPCTEGVSWNLLKNTEKVCPAQVSILQGALATSQAGIGFNNRVTQPLYHRAITEMSSTVPITRIGSTTASQWTAAIAMASKQRMLSQRIPKEFLFLSMNLGAATNKANCIKHINLFENSLRSLMEGSKDGTIPPVPIQRILNAMYGVQYKWVFMKQNLMSNMETIYTSQRKQAILEALYTQNMDVLAASAAVVGTYTDGAKANGQSIEGLDVDVAGRQRMLSQKMSKEALFIGANVFREQTLDTMSSTMSLFEDSHRDIVRGVGSLPDMPQLSDVCTIEKMKAVNGIWNNMQPFVSEIIDNYVANEEGLLQIMALNVPLLSTMNEAVGMYTATTNVCDVAATIAAQGWIKSLSEIGKQRVATQQSLTLFLRVVKGVQVAASKTALTTAMAEGSDALRYAIEGSYYLAIPSAPTQAFVDALLHAEKYWAKVTSHIGKDLLASDLSKIDVTKTAYYADIQAGEMDVIAQMYVQATMDKFPALRILVAEISWRQRILVEQMFKATIFVSLGKNVQLNTDTFATVVTAFATQHQELLVGRVAQTDVRRRRRAARRLAESSNDALSVKSIFLDHGFDSTTDACTLTLMANVLAQFDTLKGHLHGVITGTVLPENQVSTLIAAVSSIADLSISSLEVVEKFSAIQLTPDVCNTQLLTKEWQSGIQNSGKAVQLVRQGQQNLYLLASGLAVTWMSDAQVALSQHRQYITDDVESPTLVIALQAFINGWFEMGQSDVERSFNLKTAYITQNPHPVGSKLNLDFAVGQESYHVAHKEYHPIYRDILYLRDYYDIFIFDTLGNLVYTVYKEADFATNFALDGDGEWKTSGLGEVYRDATNDPTKLHVVDWSPYGPSAGALASFLAKAIMGPAGQVVGVYSTQMPPSSKPIDCKLLLSQATVAMDKLVIDLKYGVPSDSLPPPPKQSIAGGILALTNAWKDVRAMFTVDMDTGDAYEAAQSLRTNDAKFVQAADALTKTYVDEAWKADKTVPGTKIMIANAQQQRISKMAADTVLFFMNPHLRQLGYVEVTPEEMVAQMEAFEAQQLIVTDGRKGRRLAEDEYVPVITDVVPSTDAMVVKLLDDAESSWTTLKTILTGIALPPEGVVGIPEPLKTLRSVVESSDAVNAAQEETVMFFSSKVDIVVLQPISIMAPMPLTGKFNYGVTMRAAARIAEGYINEEQVLLPGYSLQHVFFDDKCIPTVSSQIVLREMASTIQYIGVGGSGCSAVCAGTAFVAESIRLPYLSYECAGWKLSDTNEYPDLTRFGTVTTPQVDVIKEISDRFAEWTNVEVFSADPAVYRADAERLLTALLELGISGSYANAYEDKFEDVVSGMDSFRLQKRRAIFVMGSEAFVRKALCASIVVKANTGITWMSEGAWREQWWTKSDTILDSHKSWIQQDAQTADVKTALDLFIKGWNALGATDVERSGVLVPLYVTDLKENLDFVKGDELYHVTHKTWHPVYRKQMQDRDYYDVFMFDLKGNMVYSVYKESDYATNFGSNPNLDADFKKWQSSGLGDAFRLAFNEPALVHETPWTPYGPSAGALASFLATGVSDEQGNPLGVFSTQMPPSAMSINAAEPQCTLEAITTSFEGSLNFVGLGRPIPSQIENQVPCFKGRTALAFLELLDLHLAKGYPLDDESTQISDPYKDIKNHAADGTCVFAYAVKQLMEDGISLVDIQKNTPEAYAAFIDYIKRRADFQGLSGRVKFDGNDKPAYLSVQQIQAGVKKTVGTTNGTIDLTVNGGPSNASWKPAYPDAVPPEADFPYFVFQVLLPILCICCPALGACIRNF